MLESITYYPVLGKPLILYGGIATLLSLLATAAVAMLNKRGIRTIPFQWHHRIALLTLTLALIHGTLGLLAYF
ncbi:MAG: hypothetical protein PHG85_01785 [Candidatus Altiarchaeota archaeon]|nr:hypothetical protein [Candidatus Altiarchaeota archaeon]